MKTGWHWTYVNINRLLKQTWWRLVINRSDVCHLDGEENDGCQGQRNAVCEEKHEIVALQPHHHLDHIIIFISAGSSLVVSWLLLFLPHLPQRYFFSASFTAIRAPADDMIREKRINGWCMRTFFELSFCFDFVHSRYRPSSSVLLSCREKFWLDLPENLKLGGRMEDASPGMQAKCLWRGNEIISGPASTYLLNTWSYEVEVWWLLLGTQ
jgi:hypothetical protein